MPEMKSPVEKPNGTAIGDVNVTCSADQLVPYITPRRGKTRRKNNMRQPERRCQRISASGNRLLIVAGHSHLRIELSLAGVGWFEGAPNSKPHPNDAQLAYFG